MKRSSRSSRWCSPVKERLSLWFISILLTIALVMCIWSSLRYRTLLYSCQDGHICVEFENFLAERKIYEEDLNYDGSCCNLLKVNGTREKQEDYYGIYLMKNNSIIYYYNMVDAFNEEVSYKKYNNHPKTIIKRNGTFLSQNINRRNERGFRSKSENCPENSKWQSWNNTKWSRDEEFQVECVKDDKICFLANLFCRNHNCDGISDCGILQKYNFDKKKCEINKFKTGFINYDGQNGNGFI